MPEPHTPRPEPRVEDFLVRPTRDLDAWLWLWQGDHAFPITSHRGGFVGRLLVGLKKLLRPLARLASADSLDRQRTFNLITLERLREHDVYGRRLDYLESLEERLRELESFRVNFVPRTLEDVLRHNDALFARVDQKLDRTRRESAELFHRLGAALAVTETPSAAPGAAGAVVAELQRVRSEQAYLALEARYRGTEQEIAERIAGYLPRLESAVAARPVLDLGCGRGEALRVLQGAGFSARGVDSSAEMVAACQAGGLNAEVGDLFGALAAVAPGSLGAVVSFHVIEHLPASELDRLLRLAWRALGPGGLLILETPNPLSLMVAARSFWLDPTHQRPVHPDSLLLFARLAGFEPVERLDLRPFPPAERLPEVDLAGLAPELQGLAHQVNGLRDRLDDLLFGSQDYALLATRP